MESYIGYKKGILKDIKITIKLIINKTNYNCIMLNIKILFVEILFNNDLFMIYNF